MFTNHVISCFLIQYWLLRRSKMSDLIRKKKIVVKNVIIVFQISLRQDQYIFTRVKTNFRRTFSRKSLTGWSTILNLNKLKSIEVIGYQIRAVWQMTHQFDMLASQICNAWELALSWWRMIRVWSLVLFIFSKTSGKQIAMYHSELTFYIRLIMQLRYDWI